MLQALHDMLDGGMDVMPGIGSDIADPGGHRERLPGDAAGRMLSMMDDGVAARCRAYPRMTIPLLLFTSPQDHVVEPAQADYLAEHYGAPVERIILERSYHVATQDFDKQLIFDAARRLRQAGHRADVRMVIGPASIPSPSSGSLEIGPLSLHLYGVMIALGVIAAVWLAGRRAEEAGAGTRDDIAAMAVWAVVAGVIGARLYHVVTDWEKFQRRLPGGSSRSGRAAWASPAASSAASLVGMWRRSGEGIAVGPVLTAARRRSPSPRRSGAGATTSTRSCSASRRRCRGRCASTPTRSRHGYAAGHHVPPDVPLRVAVEPRPVRRAAAHRPALPAAPGPAAGRVHRRLRHRPVLDRGTAHRRRQRRSAGCG